MPYTFMPTEGGGGLSGLLDIGLGAANIYRALRPAQVPAPFEPPSTSVFDIPGIDIQWPVRSEATSGAMDACGMLMSPWAAGGGGPRSARPKPHVLPNPTTGKDQWFVPARITGWKMTHVRKPRRRCACRKR